MDINISTQNLTELLANSVNLTDVFYDLFINTKPMDITLKVYNSDNKLVDVVIPNRAKDRMIAIEGEGSPEGKVVGNIGECYVDTENSVVWFKVHNNPDGTASITNLYAWSCIVSTITQTIYTQTETITENTTLFDQNFKEYSGKIFGITESGSSYVVTYLPTRTPMVRNTPLDITQGTSKGWVVALTEDSIADILSGYVKSSRTINNKPLTSNITLDSVDVGALPSNTKYGRHLSVDSSNIILSDQNNNVLDAVAIATIQGANADLSNLTSTGESHFANPNLTNLSAAGQELISSLGGKIYNSFGFNVVGGLTISSSGLASGFSTTKYITSLGTFNSSTAFTVKASVNTGSNITTDQTVFDAYSNADNYFRIGIKDSHFYINYNGTETQGANTISTSYTYNIRLEFDGNLTIKLWVPIEVGGIVTELEDITLTLDSVPTGTRTLIIGVTGAHTIPFTNSLDIKGFSVVSNNSMVISGALLSTLEIAEDSKVVHLTKSETISGTKTFTGNPVFTSSNMGEQLTVNRSNNTSGYSVIRYTNGGTLKGYLGISHDGKPLYGNASGTFYNVLRNSTLGTAVGSATKPVYITADGVATVISSYEGNSASATKLANARTIQTNLASTASASFNGTANITPGVTGVLPVANGGTGQTSVANIQAGKDGSGNTITSTYVNLTGAQTISGAKTINNDLTFSNVTTGVRGIKGIIGGSDGWRVVGGATASDAGYLELATSDNGNEPIYIRQYSDGAGGSAFTTIKRTATLLDASGNTQFPGTVKVGGGATLSYNSTTQSLDFIFS